MKKENATPHRGARPAEDWVAIAKAFGEECVKIDKETQLSLDQKLEKRKKLAHDIKKEIESDASLGQEDKHQMLHAIDSYLEDWELLHQAMQAR